MNLLISILILALFITAPSDTSSNISQFDYESQIGIVSVSKSNELCLNIRNPKLISGDEVMIVWPDKPQSLAQAKLVETIGKTCSTTDMNDERDSHYKLTLIKGRIDRSTVGIAVAKSKATFVPRRDVASADLDGDGSEEQLRVCASSEGLHLTVWRGKALTGKRVWHRYYYLGYDLEANCTEKETNEP